MSYAVFADGSANLPRSESEGVNFVPCHFYIDGTEQVYTGEVESYDLKKFYQAIRDGREIKTTLINQQQFIDSFAPVLEAGMDVVYISMASGISGTYHAACMAAEDLEMDYPGRVVRIIDGKTCGMGSGLQVMRAVELQKEGLSASEAADILNEEVEHRCSYFTVDEIKYLERTGRISSLAAAACKLLNIKPILYGSSEAKIEKYAISRGRKKSIKDLAQRYKEKAVDPGDHVVAISHGDCLEDAEYLASLINEIAKPKRLIIVPHEPFSGAHVGPGMLGLFFNGDSR